MKLLVHMRGKYQMLTPTFDRSVIALSNIVEHKKSQTTKYICSLIVMVCP